MRRSLALATLLLLLAPILGAQAAVRVVAAASAVAIDSTPVVPRGYVRLTLPVAVRALARGDTLRAESMRLVDTLLVWRWNTPPDTTRAIAGWVTRRAIAEGELLRAPAVMAPPLVTMGTPVSVIYQDGPVRLVLAGTATNTAPLGATVGVRIDRTRRLDGIVVAPNTVRLR